MSKKILSVVVPSYNMEKYLPKCLGSLLVDDNTLLEKLEVIVVNDGSKDRTSGIAHRFEAEYPGVFRVIDKQNGNFGSCINAALSVTNGCFVRILDADDYLDAETFGEYLDYIKRLPYDVDLVINDFAHVDADGRVLSKCRHGLPCDKNFSLAYILSTSCPWLSPPAIAYRRELLMDMGYRQTEGISYTDSEWFTLPLSRVRRARYFPKIVSNYLLGRDGQTMNAETFAKNVWMLEKIAHRYADDYPQLLKTCEPSAREYFMRRVIDHFQLVYTSVLIGCFGVRSSFNLVQFDDWLKTAAPEIYTALEERCVPSKWKFLYIKEWRKRRSRSTVLFFLFDFYMGVIKLKQRIYKVILKSNCV